MTARAALTLPTGRGGWWHDYVCPVHGTELVRPAGPDGDEYPCPHGCRLRGEPYRAAWTTLEHQARAREIRLLARRHRHTGDPSDGERAVGMLEAYARLYAEVNDAGWSERAQPWMLPGTLFAQALTEALWAAQIADAVAVLASSGATRPRLTGCVDLLNRLAATMATSRRVLVVERDDLRSNYTAWLDCAGATTARALNALGEPADRAPWTAGAHEHIRAAVGEDGWEWEGATYYHLFVLRAYLMALGGTDPADLPPDVADRLAAMVRVVSSLATPNGELPVLHDGPYRRDGALLEVIEVCALARQLWAGTGLDQVERHARAALSAPHDGLEDLLDGWFAGRPRDGGPAASRESVRFTDAGVVVLRDPGDTWQAVLDAGPHGGSHGHLDKLALYLYGRDEPWQPAPGVPPYASPLRRGYYARTLAHPTVRVDGVDQEQCAGRLVHWDPGGPDGLGGWSAARAVAETAEACPGVTLRRDLTMTGQYLLDAFWVEDGSGAEHDVSLGLRPSGTLEVHACGDRAWRTRWEGGERRALHGRHVSSGAAHVAVAPGRGPADDPAAVRAVADWTARTSSIAFVSVYWPGDAGTVTDLAIRPDTDGDLLVSVRLPGDRLEEHRLGGPSKGPSSGQEDT